MGDQNVQQQLHLFKLPEEITEIITSYLDLIDLKNLSLSCHYLSEVCGKRLGKHFKIRFYGILIDRDLKTFENSKRKYENVEVQNCWDLEELEGILKQVQSLPSIEMKYIHVLVKESFKSGAVGPVPEIKLNDMLVFFKKNAPMIKEIFTKIYIDSELNIENYEKILTTNYAISEVYKLSFELEMDSPIINFRQINMDFNYPTKIYLNKNINVDHLIENVKELTLYNTANESELKWFTKLEKLNIWRLRRVNLDLIRAAITTNKKTLRNLQLNSVDITALGKNFELPCQLKTFKCVEGSRQSSIPTTFLVSQRNLRSVKLYDIKLTNDLLDTLSNQKMLSKLSLEHCSFEDSLDIEKFEFIKNVLEINCLGLLLVMNIIFKYADKVEKLSLHYYYEQVFLKSPKKFKDDLDNEVDQKNGRKLLSNLKILEISGNKFSELVMPTIESPNLEKCCINCNPNLLYDCQRLRNLKITAILNPMDIQNLLLNLPSLEVIELTIDHTHLEETIQYVLRNINNVLFFRLYCRGGRLSSDQTMEYKNMIAETLNNLEISYLERFRHNMVYSKFVCNKFSFQIDFDMTITYYR